jgi:hypothetical protein
MSAHDGAAVRPRREQGGSRRRPEPRTRAGFRPDGRRSARLRPVGPGLWVPTPPGFQPALQPFWGANRCILLGSGADCPPGDHTSYSVEPSSTFYAEAVEVYDAVNHLTLEQRAIATFWSDDPGLTATPPGHSVSIATQVRCGPSAPR